MPNAWQTLSKLNLDPHMKALADVLVGVVVREIQKQKPGDGPGSCMNVPLGNDDRNDEKHSTNGFETIGGQ